MYIKWLRQETLNKYLKKAHFVLVSRQNLADGQVGNKPVYMPVGEKSLSKRIEISCSSSSISQ
jgi:hypothetical protein